MTAYLCALSNVAQERITVCIPGQHQGQPEVMTASWPLLPQSKHCVYNHNPYVRVCFHIGVAEVARQDAERQGMELT